MFRVGFLMKEYTLKTISWRDKAVAYSERFEPISGGRMGKFYQVKGFKTSEGYEPVPIRFQKNVRAFLRGTRRQTNIRGLSKITFDK